MEGIAKAESRHHTRVSHATEDECIRMKAGVVNSGLCDWGCDCNLCAFDKTMHETMNALRKDREKAIEPGWAELLRSKYRGADRPCLHTLTGRIDVPKICPYNYECYHCPFDQMLDEQDLAEAAEASAARLPPERGMA